MTIEILMPALSPTMTEGNLVKWHKKAGDSVESGDLLAEIETDKATMEVEAVDEGILGKILVEEGAQNVTVNKPIAILLEEGENEDALENYTPSSPEKKEEPEKKEKVETKKESILPELKAEVSFENKKQTLETGKERIISSPLARRLAEKNNININEVAGTGPRNRIIKKDIDSFLSSQKNSSISSFSKIVHTDSLSISYRDESLSQVRRIIAQRLSKSKQEIPHFYVSMDYNMDDLLKVRKTLNEESGTNQKLSVNDFIIKACSLALKDVPKANAIWMDDYIRYYDNVDISVAVSIEEGLITPIIRCADQKSLMQISLEAKELIKKARENKLVPEEFQGGTFSISNMGMFGVRQFNAIINQPQACIIAIGAAEKRPVVIENKIELITQMTATLSVDHRIVDGSVAAELLVALKRYIENPILLTLR